LGALKAAAAPTPVRLAATPDPASVLTVPLGEAARMRWLLLSAKIRLPYASTAPTYTMPIRLLLSGPSAKPHDKETAVSVALPATVDTKVRFALILRIWQPYGVGNDGKSEKNTEPSGATSAEFGYATRATLTGPSAHPWPIVRPA